MVHKRFTPRDSCRVMGLYMKTVWHAWMNDFIGTPLTHRQPQIDQNAEQDTIDVRDGVAMDPIIDDEYHDDFEWMDIDLPGDSAVSNREYTLLRNMRKQLADVKMRHCSTCCERGFDARIADEMTECRRCQADKHEDGKVWSNANTVNPCTLLFMPYPIISHHYSRPTGTVSRD